MANRLKDRKETLTVGKDTYTLCLIWDRDGLRRCAFGMPPMYSYIRKNGKNYADIKCYSNDDGFTVVAFHGLMEKAEWEIRFSGKDINVIPFDEIIMNIPH